VLPLLFAAVLLIGEGLPVKAPSAVGMSAARLKSIDRLVSRGIISGGYPGASVVVGRKGAAVWQKGFGRLTWNSSSDRVTTETIYDLASLTKVVATTSALMILFDEGKIHLDDPVHTYIPEFTGGQKDSITLRQLLEHRSGLPADRELWHLANSPDGARAAVFDTPLECHPGDCFIYSDLGAILLGVVVERVSGESLDSFVRERIYSPLGMTNTFFKPADSLKSGTAPTELASARGYALRGEVHDENAYALGGVAGHAGLFSTAADLAIFAQMMLNGGEYNGTRIISDSTVKIFTSRASGSRALGWAMADGQWGSGRYLSDRAYGHVGFTGTSIWIDPDREMFVILLTNRVYEARARHPSKVIADVRADLADVASAAVTGDPGQTLAMPASFRADLRRGWNHVEHRHRHHRSSHKSHAHSSTKKSSKKKHS